MRNRLWHGVSRRARALPWRTANYVAEIGCIAAMRTRRYRQASSAHFAALPILPVVWADIAQTLGTHGAVQRDLASLRLPGSAAMLDAANALVDRWRASLREQALAGADFLAVPAADLATRPEIYRFGLDRDLLKLVESYLGLPVGYDGVTIQYTIADGRAVSTRDWHRDREDRRMVKLAIYLDDVDDAGGPFQLLPEASGPDRRNRFYLEDSERVDMAEGLRFAPPISCEGAAGTVVFADTARYFHRGKPATGKDRAAIFFSYFTRVPQRPYFCDRSGLSRRQVAAMVEGLGAEQRAAALWREALPLHWRLIPPAAV